MRTHVDLFSGIGGFALACQANAVRTVQFVEIDARCRAFLAKAWLGIPIWDDIRTFRWNGRMADAEGERAGRTAGELQPQDGRQESGQGGESYQSGEGGMADPDRCGELRTGWASSEQDGNGQDGRIHNGGNPVWLLTGGVPCQPASRAGRQLGADDVRWLWPEAVRCLAEIRPTWALLENPPGIGDVGLAGILALYDDGWTLEEIAAIASRPVVDVCKAIESSLRETA